MSTLKLRNGGYYKTRDGRTVGPAEPWENDTPGDGWDECKWSVNGLLYQDGGHLGASDGVQWNTDVVEEVAAPGGLLLQEGHRYRLKNDYEGVATRRDGGYSYEDFEWVIGGVYYRVDGAFAGSSASDESHAIYDVAEEIGEASQRPVYDACGDDFKRLLEGKPMPILPTGSASRKDTPIHSGVVKYFPRSLAYIAQISKAGNDKHNPGEPLHWSRGKSNDHLDCALRHAVEVGTVDPDDGFLHDGKLAWRALANLEEALEKREWPQKKVT